MIETIAKAGIAVGADGLFMETHPNPAVAKSFRDNILSKGNSEDPMILYVKFRGQEPSTQALLERSGLVPAKK